MTINKEHRLQKQLDQYNKKSGDLQLIRTQITESYEQKIELIKEEMESKFQESWKKLICQKCKIELTHCCSKLNFVMLISSVLRFTYEIKWRENVLTFLNTKRLRLHNEKPIV